MTNTATATRFEIRARLWPEHMPPAGTPAESEHITAAYDRATAAEALAAFAADHPEVVKYGSRWNFECVIPAATPRPPRRFLLNWERDRDAEVSDGWLSNIAANGNNLMDTLEWEPEFCSHPHRKFPCPSCGGSLAERWGKFGGFYTCGCGFKTSMGTKKAAAIEDAATVTGWCGTKLEVFYNNNGVPYPGCKTCNPKYGKGPTVNDIYYGKR
jgi:hypothetical protein